MLDGNSLMELIKMVGLFGVVAIVFAESGLLIGFFLPGDSLLFTAGFLASQGFANIHMLALLTFLAAVLGDSFGYMFGKRVGKGLFERKNSKLFSKDNLLKAQSYYEKHGSKTIVLARFVPIVRTFAPIVAGTAEMKYSTFLTYNVIGGAVWALGMSYAGYFLGSMIPDVDKYLLPIIAVIILLSIAPTAFEYYKHRKASKVISAPKESGKKD